MDASELKAAIQAMAGRKEDTPLVKFPTPEWPKLDGHVFIRGLSGTEGDEHEIFIAQHSDKDGKITPGTRHVSAALCVRALCDVNGQRIFSDTPDDLAILGPRANILLTRAYFTILKLSGIGKKAAEALEKNLGTTPGDSLPST